MLYLVTYNMAVSGNCRALFHVLARFACHHEIIIFEHLHAIDYCLFDGLYFIAKIRSTKH